MIFATCALFGLVLSIVLLRLGLEHMGVRYLVCFSLAYAFFLILLRLAASLRNEPEVEPEFDTPTPVGDRPEGLDGGGGQFGGGGASGSWEDDAAVPAPSDASLVADATDVVDLDEGLVLAVPAAIVIGVLLAATYVISVAPILLAEVVLDVGIAAGAYRGASRLDPQHWAVGAVRRTWGVAVVGGLLLVVVGSLLQLGAPGAHTIGAALAAF